MFCCLNSSAISKWRKHHPPSFINLAKGNRYRMLIQRPVLHWNLSRLLWRNVHKFFHCFSMAKENQPRMLLEMVTEKIHLKSEVWHHVSMMKIEKCFSFLGDLKWFCCACSRSTFYVNWGSDHGKLLWQMPSHFSMRWHNAFVEFFLVRFSDVPWFAASTDLSSESNTKNSSKWKFSYSYASSSTASGQLGIGNFSFEEIYKSTAKFSPNNEIGQGGFGTVYKGKLNDGSIVAVKRAKKVH